MAITQPLHVPSARVLDLITTQAANNLLVYDLTTHHLHQLNGTVAAVWPLCDGQRSLRDLSAETGLSDEIVRSTLRHLSDDNLLVSPYSPGVAEVGTSRRAGPVGCQRGRPGTVPRGRRGGCAKDTSPCRSTIMVRVFTVCLLALVMMSSPAQAQDTIIVGVDPAMYEIVVAGVQGWNEAGLGFVVQASGCGTGDVTFCYSADPWSAGGNADWVAWWVIGGDTIYVSSVTQYPFLPPTVCHELGHWLGLHYHRTDGASCMRDNGQTSASPDGTDLERLGWSQ